MTPVLALFVAAAELVAKSAAIMKPPFVTSGEEGAQPALMAGASGTGHEAWHQKCPLAYDSLQLTAAEAHSPGLLLDQEGLAHGSVMRSCDSPIPVRWLRPLVLPEYKLAFCYIPKVACTDFKDLFNLINGAPAWTRGYGRYYNFSFPDLQGLAMSDLTRENGWKFAAFTRDPVLKYVSAFGDVCQAGFGRADVALHSCCGTVVNTSSVTREELISDFKARVQYDLKEGRPDTDQHWASQTETLANCGWDNFKPENLDYWGTLHGDMNAQVTEMMQMVGYSNSTAVEMFFPPDNITGHTSKVDAEPLDFVDDLATLEGIAQMYAEDYRNLPGIGCSFTEPLLAKLKGANASSH